MVKPERLPDSGPLTGKEWPGPLAAGSAPGLLLAIMAAVLLANDIGIGATVGLVAGFALLTWLIFVIDTLRKAGKMADALINCDMVNCE